MQARWTTRAGSGPGWSRASAVLLPEMPILGLGPGGGCHRDRVSRGGYPATRSQLGLRYLDMGSIMGTRIPGIKVFNVMLQKLRVRQLRLHNVGDDIRRLSGVVRAVGTVSRMVPGILILLRMCLLLHVVARMVHYVMIPSPYMR